MFCAKCGAEQQADARFCSGCGAELAASLTPDTPPPAPVTPGSQPPKPPAKGGMPGWLIGCLIALVVGLLLGGAGVVVLLVRTKAKLEAELRKPPDIIRTTPDNQAPEPSPDADKPEPTPEPAPEKEPAPGPDALKKLGGEVASVGNAINDARKVMESFVAADIKHDGYAMQKLMGGAALKDFLPDIQGQGDAETVSETITKSELVSAQKVRFQVCTKMRDIGTSAEANSYEWYELTKSGKGWKITKVQYGE